MKEKILKIVDLLLIIILITLVTLKLYPYVENTLYKNAKVDSSNPSLDYAMAGNMEYLLTQYYGYIQAGQLEEVNEICASTCQKSNKDLDSIKRSAGMFEIPRVKVFELTEVAKDVYAMKFIIKESGELEDNKNYYSAVIKLMPEETLYNVLNDNWVIE